MRTVLITGGSGWLGQFVYKELMRADPMSSFVHITYNNNQPGEWIMSTHAHRLDLSDEVAVRELIERIRPDVVLHLAAMTSPGACERDKELAMKVNR